MSLHHHIFISYSRKDSVKVKSIVANIKDRTGLDVWIDEKGIEGGANFKDIIVDAIDSSHLVLFFSSKYSNQSIYTASEISLALKRGKTIIPVLIDHTPFNSSLEFDLVNLNFIDLTDSSSYERSLTFLLDTIVKQCSGVQITQDSIGFEGRADIRRKRMRIALTIALSVLVVSSIFIIRGIRIRSDYKMLDYYSSVICQRLDSLSDNNIDRWIKDTVSLKVYIAECEIMMEKAVRLGRRYSNTQRKEDFDTSEYIDSLNEAKLDIFNALKKNGDQAYDFYLLDRKPFYLQNMKMSYLNALQIYRDSVMEHRLLEFY